MYNILVLGDSHIDVFRFSNMKTKYFNFITVEVPGATAMGSTNPNSETNALNIFTDILEKYKTELKQKIHYVMIMLGEVDCGFVIWVRSKKYNISIDEQLNLSISNYKCFIKNVIFKYFNPNQVILLGSILPTIKDNTDKRFLNGVRSEVDTPLKKRIETTLQYNNNLLIICKELKTHYTDITDKIINNEHNSVKNKYLNKNPFNHHLDNFKTYRLWCDNLKDIILNNPQS